MPKKKTQRIPLCRSSFLQDITISLGQRSKGFCYQLRKFSCTRSEHSGSECLQITCEELDGAVISFSVWDDGIAHLQYWRRHLGKRGVYRWSFHPVLDKLSSYGIIDALKHTIENSSPVFSGPNYFDRIRSFWGHCGAIEEMDSQKAKEANQPPQPTPLKRRG